jgi:hypothetical protein
MKCCARAASLVTGSMACVMERRATGRKPLLLFLCTHDPGRRQGLFIDWKIYALHIKLKHLCSIDCIWVCVGVCVWLCVC